MNEEKLKIGPYTIQAYSYSVLIAGSGAAGLNAADTLYDEGIRDIAIITEGFKAGTSRNTGSDKQTYYKLSLAGDAPDSVRALAETLFAGGSADGDIALCEAAASVPCFMKLVHLGIPFPKNRWGEYVGYKTDHDPARRATSAGPYTSRFMVEALEKQIVSKGIKVFDHYQIVRLLTEGTAVKGILCLNNNPDNIHAEAQKVTGKDITQRHKGTEEKINGTNRQIIEHSEIEKFFTIFLSDNIVWATGGPAGIYDNVVYPQSQNGAMGAAFEAGAMGRNLTEWQFGLASVNPRWNVSGTFMQVLPRFISVDSNGKNEREFLADNFYDQGEMLSLVFLKGYQWPFDSRKIFDGKKFGSSIIDILVHLEMTRGRRVFLDFRKNPGQKNLDFSLLSDEARTYLEAADACFGTPYERLEKMNKPAAEFYKGCGIDLSSEPLEIALCAQHNNGGLAVDHNWQSSLEGLFPAGEAAATHGVYRPGGSALNAGQAGSMRAALFIARKLKDKADMLWKANFIPEVNTKDSAGFSAILEDQILEMAKMASGLCSGGQNSAADLLKETRKKMSLAGGAFRDLAKIQETLKEVRGLREHLTERIKICNTADLALVFRLRDTLICQEMYLSAMADFAVKSGRSRGSALYFCGSGSPDFGSAGSGTGEPNLHQVLSFLPDDGSLNKQIQEIRLENNKPVITWREVRPIPDTDESFEVIWKEFRENG